MEQRIGTAGPATASVPDTLRAVAGVLAPLAVRGVIIRRQRVVALLERVDADRRLVRALQRLRRRYGPGPLHLRLPLRRIVLVLADDDVHRVLAASPDPFATATREKRAALGRFGPHGVLISKRRRPARPSPVERGGAGHRASRAPPGGPDDGGRPGGGTRAPRRGRRRRWHAGLVRVRRGLVPRRAPRDPR